MPDLDGQVLDLSIAALLSEGLQRKSVRTLGCLFYIGNRNRDDLLYRDKQAAADAW